MKVRVDEKVCQGHGLCVVYAPKVFALDENTGLAKVQLDQLDKVDDDQKNEVLEAVNACPVRAISIVKD